MLGDEVIEANVKDISGDNIQLFVDQPEDLHGMEVRVEIGA